MSNPTIYNSDNSSLLMFNGIFRDRDVTVGAGETLVLGTVLALNTTTGKIVVCESDGTDGEDAPRFILMEVLDNSLGGAAADFDRAQVLVGGEVDGAKLIFANGTDTLATLTSGGVFMEDALKTEGIIINTRSVEDELDNQ